MPLTSRWDLRPQHLTCFLPCGKTAPADGSSAPHLDLEEQAFLPGSGSSDMASSSKVKCISESRSVSRMTILRTVLNSFCCDSGTRIGGV